MKSIFALLLSLLIISCSNPQEQIYFSFGEAYDNKDQVYQFDYNPEISGVISNYIPDIICEFPVLSSFRMAEANLKKIPDCMYHIETLRSLELENNPGIEISSDIQYLTSLNYLALINNNLNNLPESICKLTNLKKLYLRGNNLTKLPNDIRMLSKLETLDLAYNNFSENEKTRIIKALPNCEIWWD